MRIRSFVLGVAVIGAASACGDDDPSGPAQQIYQATLSGANERPAPITTTGTGFFNGVISDGNFLNYTISWSGLSSASNNGHFHGPQTTGATAVAGVALDLNAPTAGRTITHSNASGGAGSAQGQIDLKGSVALANGTTITGDSLKKLLDTGGLYINIHTVNNPGGEILGVITKQ
jgi:hypothetical protein